jgi:hypothetical protein
MSISLNEALNKSEYDEFIKDKVKSFVLENYKNYKDKSNLYLTKCFNKKIFVIKMDLYVTYKATEYILTVLIYIPNTFPNELRIYFEYNQDFIIDRYYQQEKIIDETTAELDYFKIINYIPLKNPLNDLVKALIDKFNQKFPLFKAKVKPELYGPCHLDISTCTKIEIKPDDIKEINKLDNDKKKIKDKIMKTLEKKVYEIQSTQSQLDILKNRINTKINNYISKNKSDELEKMIKNMVELQSKIEQDIQRLKYQKNNENNNILQKCEEAVEIKDKEKFRYQVMMKSAEDFLLFIKKGFERNIIPFNKGVDEIRRISKELFFINYCIQKNNP